MAIRYAILGLLSWQPLTGYDLKQIFRDSATMYWSGSSNQIYRTLVKLHDDALVTRETVNQDSGPSRKIYTITDAGRAELRTWLLSPPELPEIKHPFLIQLAWADQLDPDELDGVLAQYEEEVRVKRLMLCEQLQRDAAAAPGRTPREALLWERIAAHWIATYERELAWVQTLRADLRDL
ncbi:MAG: PadR family transcriptional regulator [Anaerolineae bacterium]|nr:PadR family transcriptional regulator [Anaerolineae bacterium]